MSTAMKRVPLLVLFALIIAVPSVWAYWVQDGVALCTATGGQGDPQITSDGAGGAIVTWYDFRSGDWDIYAQRVNASGAVQWTANGVALCTSTGGHPCPQITSDGAGGAIVTWYDFGSENYDIYAQRVIASGAVVWNTDGVALCTAPGYRQYLQITSDGAGGAIVTWMDYRSGNYNIYAQRVNASGAVVWNTDGVPLCTATGDRFAPTIVSDGAGGAIVTWRDGRNGSNYDIYAQRVNALGAVLWNTDGTALCTATGVQQYPTITSDGAGGAIVTWEDLRSGDNDIYAQRVNASGSGLWNTDGVALCTATGNQGIPTLASDGAGGAIVTWMDYRSGSYSHIYAQRVNASGAVQWTANGAALCTATGDRFAPTIVSDGAGAAIVTWEDYRSGSYSHIYAQRVNASGTVQWTANGVALCTATGYQSNPTMVSDGTGDAIVTWRDGRSGNYDIYAQIIDSSGRAGGSCMAPDILSVLDIPHDEGGWVRLTIGRALLDSNEEANHPIAMYNVWQRIDDPALLEAAAGERGTGVPVFEAHITNPALIEALDAFKSADWPVKEAAGRYFVQSKELLGGGILPLGTWELLGSFAACQQDQYIYRASTLADSTASGIPYSVYIVSAHTTTPAVWFASDPDSGCSVDNIAPGAPVGLAAEQSYKPAGLTLSWDVNGANDLSHYAIYRGLRENFAPGPSNRVATPTEPEWFDGSWRWNCGYYYKVSAIDIHANQSSFALVGPNDVTGIETPKVPDANYLSQNYPNPFNPSTRIAFGLVVLGHVELRIYDATGRLVRVLVNDERPRGHYEEAWDGRDSRGHAVASGIYFCRLAAGSFVDTKKMTLTR